MKITSKNMLKLFQDARDQLRKNDSPQIFFLIPIPDYWHVKFCDKKPKNKQCKKCGFFVHDKYYPKKIDNKILESCRPKNSKR